MENSKNTKSLFVFIATSLVILAGVYFRLKGLGKWPFALDEYYIIRSVQNILKHGLPQFDAGGYYSRGLIYQYMIAPLLLIGIKAEFAARIIPVIANLLAIPPLYLLSKKLSGKTVAFTIIIIFSFSLWEIEFSRFARMYTMFQAVFVWYLYFLYKYLFENNRGAIKWLLGLSFVSIFIYEASIFLVVLNFVIFLWNYDKKNFEIKLSFLKNNLVYLLVSLIIFFIAYFYLSFDFRTLHATNLLPPELSAYFNNLPKETKFRLPIVLLSTATSSLMGFLFFILTVLPGLWIAFKVVSDKDFDLYAKLSLTSILFFVLLNLYGLVIIFTIFSLLMNWLKISEYKSRNMLLVILIIITSFLLQNIFAVFNHEWKNLIPYKIEPGFIQGMKVLWKEFINYPNFYELFALFRDTYKLHTFLSVAIISAGTLALILNKKEDKKPIKIYFALFIVLLFAVTFLNTKYFTTRYFFFLFPLFYICILVSIDSLIEVFVKKNNLKNVFVLIMGLLFFIVSEDSSAYHLLHIDSVEVNFRKNMSVKLRDHFYPRWDSKSVADTLNKIAKKDDIIISDFQISDYYLNHLDYLYGNYASNDFAIESVNYGKNERWTGAKLIYKYKDLLKLLSTKNKTKWLIINKTWGVKLLEKSGLFKLVDPYTYYKDKDGTTYLYKVPGNVKF